MRIVIIGGLHHNTLGVIRSLGEAGVPNEHIHVIVMGESIPSHNIISKSRYVGPSRLYIKESEKEVVSWLLDLSSDGIVRTIICCSDSAAEIVIGHADVLNGRFHLPFTKLPITQLMTKEYQGHIAAECGLYVPESKVISKHEYFDWSFFPCIVKPGKSTAGAGKADIHILSSKDELSNTISKIKAETIQIQRFITKKMEFQLIGCSLEAGSQVIIPGFTTIIRQPPNTNTGYLRYSPISDLDFDLAPVEKFLKMIGYSGLFSIEFIRDENNKDYFLEINMRNDGNAYCVKSAGINLPYLWCYYQHYHVLPEVNLRFQRPIYFIPDFIDLPLGVRQVGIVKWVKEFMLAKSHTLYNFKDMKPFLFELKKLVSGILYRRLLKRRGK